MFIGLNPSTADAVKNDPTIKRCIGFAKSWGFGGLVMVNLFAWRSTDPNGLKGVFNLVGTLNDEYIYKAAKECTLHVAVWGHGPLIKQVRPYRVEYVRYYMPPLWCLGTNNDGAPKHLLFIKGNTVPILYNP